MREKSLFIDETGKSHYTHSSNQFILSACSIPTEHLQDIRDVANQIIFKYWGSYRSYQKKFKTSNIGFHAKDIYQNRGVYSIFRSDPSKKESFWKDLYANILSRPDITYFIINVDKADYRTRHPNKPLPDLSQQFLDASYKKVIELFLNYLIGTKTTGEIISESSSDQDMALVRALSFFQRNSLRFHNSNTLVSQKITCLSLINKHDNSIGSQIADLMAWTGALKYKYDHHIPINRQIRKEEDMLLTMLNKRLSTSKFKYNQYVEL